MTLLALKKPLRIAADVSMLNAGGGIGRYVQEMLRFFALADLDERHWLLYGRGDTGAIRLTSEQATLRQDLLPQTLGRIASLWTSQVLWSALDKPDLFWGPAHRLPYWLPKHTARVVTVHDLCWLHAPETMHPFTRRLDAVLMPRALKQADRVIAISNATANDLGTAFPNIVDKIVVVRPGVTTLSEPVDSQSAVSVLGVSAPYVLFVGTMEPRKNLPRLLRAVAKLPQYNSSLVDVQLVIVGSKGWGGLHVEEDIVALGLSSKVKVLGKVSDENLSALYQRAECLVMPSLYEGFGFPLVEAMQRGTPVISSNTSSMPEVVGAAGLLVNPLSIDSIAQGLVTVLTDHVLRCQLASKAKKCASAYSWEKAVVETQEVFRQAVERRAAALSNR